MEKQKQIHGEQKFLFRMRIVKIAFFSMFAIIFFSLLNIQVLNHSKYSGRLKRQRYTEVKIPVPRGKILDREGRILGMDVPAYSLYLDFRKINHYKKKNPDYLEKLNKNLMDVLTISEKELEEKMGHPYPLVKRELAVEEYQKLKFKSLPGLVFSKTFKRVYPHNKLASHMVGFTGRDGNGLEGIELYYNDFLKGKQGVSLIGKDGSGNLIPSFEKIINVPEKGNDLFLTMDLKIQFIVEEEIEKARGKFSSTNITVVVMDPENGEILALANKPDYNLSMPGKLPVRFRRNMAITDFFEPGSIFKIVTATAGFEEGLISPSEIINCEKGKWFIRNHYLHDVHEYEDLSVEEIIIKSSNIGTVKIAMKLGENVLYKYCRKFGFGQITGIDFPGETSGILRPVNLWSSYSITAIPIGQEVGINSIQGIRAMAVLANGGYLVKPHVLKEVRDPSGRVTFYTKISPERVISDATCRIMNPILKRVVNTGGTAPLAQILGYHIYGKTGTAQKIENGRYSSSKHVASFVGYVLSDEKPELIIFVKVDDPKPFYYGGLVAAPIFREITWRIMQYWNIPPDENLKELQLAVLHK